MSFKTNGSHPDVLEQQQEFVEALDSPQEQEWLSDHFEREVTFAGPNSTVRVLVGRYQENPDTLTPAERLTAQRALDISMRLEATED